MHEFGWARRLRPPGPGQPGRPHHRMRLPGHRRPAHRLGATCPTGRTSATRSSNACRRPASCHQARRHRRPGQLRRDCRADAVRDRRPAHATCCPTWCATSPRCVAAAGERPRARCAARAAAHRGRPTRCRHLLDGFRCTGQLTVVGMDAARKARRTGEAILARTRALFAQGLPTTAARTSSAGQRGRQLRPARPDRPCTRGVLHLAVMHPHKRRWRSLRARSRRRAPAGHPAPRARPGGPAPGAVHTAVCLFCWTRQRLPVSVRWGRGDGRGRWHRGRTWRRPLPCPTPRPGSTRRVKRW
jgi:hypothetical protein